MTSKIKSKVFKRVVALNNTLIHKLNLCNKSFQSKYNSILSFISILFVLFFHFHFSKKICINNRKAMRKSQQNEQKTKQK